MTFIENEYVKLSNTHAVFLDLTDITLH